MDFKFDDNSNYWLNYVVKDLFEVMASNSIDNNVCLAGWDYEDVAHYSAYIDGEDGNIKDLAKIIVIKANEIEDQIGTDATIEVFRSANNKMLKNNELKDLFDRIDSLASEYEPLQEVKKRNKLKP